MKILHVMAGGKFGGAETAFVDMCIAMHQAGEIIEVATRNNTLRVGKLKQAGIKVHILSFGGVLDFITLWKLHQIIKHFQPDIVQGWMSRACHLIPKWSEKMSIPQYLTVARFGTPYKLKYYKQMQYFVALTPDIQTYLEQGGIEPSRIQQIPNFAEVEATDVQINRADFDVPESAILVLGLGRLHTDKAFDVLIKAIARLPDVYLWIAGEGPQRNQLTQLIESCQLSERVKLLGWRSDRAALFQAADVCAFISRDEGFGTVFIQSWAQRTPLIVSDSDGPRQFVKNGVDALMTPIDNVEATADCIHRLIKAPELRQMLIENGFEQYQQHFTKGVIVEAYLQFYRQLRHRHGLT